MNLPTRHTIFDFRSWPLYAGYQKLYERFGYDAMAYHMMLWQMFVLYLIISVASSAIWIPAIINDHFYNEKVFSLTSMLPRSSIRAIIWTSILFLTAIFARFIGYQRLQYIQNQQENSVQQFSVVIMNVHEQFQDQYVQMLIKQYVNATPVKYLRIQKIKSLKARRQLHFTLKDSEEFIREQGNVKSQFSWLTKLFGFAQIIQFLGSRRDSEYFEKRAQKYQKQITKNDLLKTNYDAVIVTMETKQQSLELIKKVNFWFNGKNQMQFGKVNGSKLHAIQAPAPDDIFMENLYYNPVTRFIRSFTACAIIAASSLAMFTVICIFRNKSRQQQSIHNLYLLEIVKYYAVYLCTFATDWFVRPFLYLAQGIEKHYSFIQKERAWIKKLYVYQIFNKFTIFFSRSVYTKNGVFEIKNILNIFGYTKEYRQKANNFGQDAYFYLIIVDFGWHMIDAGIFIFYWVILKAIAKTNRDKLVAMRSLPIRFASKNVYLLVVLTFILCFGHVCPTLALRVLIYFPIQSIVSRWVTLRISAPCVKTDILAYDFEQMIYVCVLIASIFLWLSYAQINQGFIYFTTVIPSVILMIQAIKMGVFDKFVEKLDKKFQEIIPKPIFSLELDSTKISVPQQWYEIYKHNISEEMLQASYQQEYDSTTIIPAILATEIIEEERAEVNK
ncbi:Transmembrane_domain-containing protein [Hexamita inflata]|uniref:Transmembrane domain-containing protein n=1 Tax=Hexamita inflata TaxID=28002 RepID=A0AA86PU62_9EUKA|nr:Transmembrane domain-containing protein [Hexamita inflata]